MRIFTRQFVSNMLQGFAIEVKTNRSYTIGLYEKGALSGLGWTRPQPGAKYGYLGMFLNGQQHGYGFRVSMLQNVAARNSRANTAGHSVARELGDGAAGMQGETRGKMMREGCVEGGGESAREQESDQAGEEEGEIVREERMAGKQEGILGLSSLLSFEKGESVEHFDDLSAIEIDGFKLRIAKVLELAFRRVKEAGEYTSNMEQPWLRDGERLMVLLNGYAIKLTDSVPTTPLADDKDYAYLKVCVCVCVCVCMYVCTYTPAFLPRCIRYAYIYTCTHPNNFPLSFGSHTRL